MNDNIKLPIKIVVNSLIKEPMLMINPEHYSKLLDISINPEYEFDWWQFKNTIEEMVE